VLSNNEKFYFLNVGQGDCSVFFIPNSKEVVIVDTGGSSYKDVAVKKIIPFLLKRTPPYIPPRGVAKAKKCFLRNTVNSKDTLMGNIQTWILKSFWLSLRDLLPCERRLAGR
jgi:hypothetical protein